MFSHHLYRDYPFPLQFQNTTLFLRSAPDAGALAALQQLIDGRKDASHKRYSRPFAAGNNELFAKIQPLNTLKSRLRVTWRKPHG